jgi:hypothetical protein
MAAEQERMQILEMIANGDISAEDGVRLLQSLQTSASERDALTYGEGALPATKMGIDDAREKHTDALGDSNTPPPVDAAPTTPPPDILIGTVTGHETEYPQGDSRAPKAPQFGKWRQWWWIPVGIGVVITVFGGLLMYWAWVVSGFGFWFACSWFPFLIGLAVLTIAVTSRRMRWLHLRIRQKPGERPRNIAISLPLPVRFIAWLARSFGHKIPHMDSHGIDGMVHALENVSPEAPFYLEVNEGEDGERVEIFIG